MHICIYTYVHNRISLKSLRKKVTYSYRRAIACLPLVPFKCDTYNVKYAYISSFDI